MDCFHTYFTHALSQCNSCSSATEWTASVHTLHMLKPNVTRVQRATQWTASVHTFDTYFTHAQIQCNSCSSATEWTASLHIHTCPNPCSKCFGMDCFDTCFTPLQPSSKPASAVKSAPFNPPSSLLEAFSSPFKPLQSLLHLRKASSPFEAPLKPLSSPLEATFKPS